MLESHQESAQPLKPAASAVGQIRYRSPSAAELESQIYAADLEGRMRKARHEPPFTSDKVHRAKIVVLLFTVVCLVSFVFFAVPRSAGSMAVTGVIDGRKFGPGGGAGGRSYAVIFDAGSSGSRVHVYCFDGKLDLVPIGKELELFRQLKPGLSSYARDPKQAANSLKPLLEEAEAVVPQELRHNTPVRVGATAGLRTLGIDTSEKILQEVRNFIKASSSLKLKDDGVSVLDGTQEGAFQWVTINYLLGNLGKKYSDTVGVVDLGGGSVQMAYAISEEDAANAPKISDGQDSYVKELFLKGRKYYLYVHSYLHYGLLAARAEILKVDEDEASFCMLNGHEGSYKYGDAEYKASASPDGPSYTKCRDVSHKALKVDEPVCTHMKCTFGGVWNGGGGDGQKHLFVASFFFDRASEAGFVDPKIPVAKVKPRDFEDAAKQACELNIKDGKSKYQRVEESNLPYLCMDLVYQYTLLVDGFGLDPMQEITLVKQVKYGDSYVEAAWPLGSAIEVASSP